MPPGVAFDLRISLVNFASFATPTRGLFIVEEFGCELHISVRIPRQFINTLLFNGTTFTAKLSDIRNIQIFVVHAETFHLFRYQYKREEYIEIRYVYVGVK